MHKLYTYYRVIKEFKGCIKFNTLGDLILNCNAHCDLILPDHYLKAFPISLMIIIIILDSHYAE